MTTLSACRPPQARHRKVDLVILPSAQAIGMLTETATDTNARSGHVHWPVAATEYPFGALPTTQASVIGRWLHALASVATGYLS